MQLLLLSPLIIGFLFGPEVLGGFFAGATVSGVLMGMFQNNAGGAWDNAKKSFEKGVEINGEMFYKKSEPHKASVTGDTVGDPFKDTSGPSMNILIKLMSIVSLVIAPTLAHVHNNTNDSDGETGRKKSIEIRIDAPVSRASVTEIKNQQTLIAAFENDGLISDDKATIAYQNNKHVIDGKEQSEATVRKHLAFQKKRVVQKFRSTSL